MSLNKKSNPSSPREERFTLMVSILGNLFRQLTYQVFSPGTLLREKYEAFKIILTCNRVCLELMAEIEMIYHDCQRVDLCRVQSLSRKLSEELSTMVEQLNRMSPVAYAELPAFCKKITFYMNLALETMQYDIAPPYLLSLRDIPYDGEPVAGGKAWRLAMIKRDLSLPIPDGFVVTASAYRYLIEANNLKPIIDAKLAKLDLHDAGQLECAAARLNEIVMQAAIPDCLAHAIREAGRLMAAKNNNLRFAVRSSAVGEDGPFSFAGQHRSVLHVSPDRLIAAYREVIASKFSSKALHYRISNGLIDVDIPMAVLFLPMLDAVSAGVIYSTDPTDATAQTIAIHAVKGLGESLVNGLINADRYEIAHDTVLNCMNVARSNGQLLAFSRNNTTLKAFDADRDRCEPTVQAQELDLLARWALRLESYFDMPLDIEWCHDAYQGLMILQARPLKVEAKSARTYPETGEDVKILIEGGCRAAGGCASGPVFLLPSGRPSPVPQGAVLVASIACPDLSLIIDRLAAAVFEVGSQAGHFASIARESGLPTLVQVAGACSCLKEGAMITVDADNCRVYEGVWSSPSAARSFHEDPFLNSPFRKKVRKALDYISNLTLTDPDVSNFAPAGCKTVHDIIRFCHERSLHEMFSLGRSSSKRARGARKLLTDLPISLYLLDISQGACRCCPDGTGGVPLAELKQESFQAFWKGLSNPDIYWDSERLFIDLQCLEQSANGGIMSLNSPLLASFAILAHDYLNLSIRFGYHFVVIDTLRVKGNNKNYVLFSFKGGGGSQAGIMLRTSFLEKILTHSGFKVTIRGDLVEAEFINRTEQEVDKALVMIGTVLGCTRFLDFTLCDNMRVGLLAQQFLDGDYSFTHHGKTHPHRRNH